MSTQDLSGGGFDFESEAGVAQLLASVRAAELNPEQRNDLRDTVFLYINGGKDESARLSLEQKLQTYSVTPVATPAKAEVSTQKVSPMGGGRMAPAGFSVSNPVTYAPTPAASAPQPASVASTEPVAPAPQPAPTPSAPAPATPTSAAPTPQVTAAAQPVPSAPAPAPTSQAAPVPVAPVPNQVPAPAPAAQITPAPAPQPAPAPATPAPAPVVGNADASLARIREIKSLVNQKVGNPVNLVDIDNEVGREYMGALLDAMKKINSGTSAVSAMQRLEAAYTAVEKVVAAHDAGATGVAESPAAPAPQAAPAPAPKPTPQPTPTPKPQPAQAPAPQPTPQPQPNPQPAPAAAPKPQPATPEPVAPKPAPAPQASTPAPTPAPTPKPAPAPKPTPQPTPTPKPQPAPQPVQKPVLQPEAVTHQPAPTPKPKPEATPAQPVKSEEKPQSTKPAEGGVATDATPSQSQPKPVAAAKKAEAAPDVAKAKESNPETPKSNITSTAPAKKIPLQDVPSVIDPDEERWAQNDLPGEVHAKKVEPKTAENKPTAPTSTASAPASAQPKTDSLDPLMTPEIDQGLEQLLAEWSLFKKSGLFGTGPKGRNHPLFLKLAGLQIPLLLAGRFEGATQEIKQSITDYMNGWRYEQGIIYKQGETFERYLRRVIKHILDLQKKGVPS